MSATPETILTQLANGLDLDKAFRKVLFGEATEVGGVWIVVAVLGGILLTYGAAEAIRRGAKEGHGVGERLLLVTLCAVAIGALSSPQLMDLAPNIWDKAAEAMGTQDYKQNLQRMSDAYLSSETSLDSITIDGANRTGFFKSLWNSTTSPIQTALAGVMRALRTWAAILLLFWVSGWLWLAWILASIVAWASKIAYLISYSLVPLAVGGMAVESLRGLSMQYMRAVVGFAAANFGVAVLNIATSAFLTWFATLAAAPVDSDSVRSSIQSAFLNPNVTMTPEMKKAIVSAFVVASPLYWLLIVLAAALLALWVIFSAFFGARMIYRTIVGGEAPGTAAFQTIGAAFAAAGNGLQLLSRTMVAGAGGAGARGGAGGRGRGGGGTGGGGNAGGTSDGSQSMMGGGSEGAEDEGSPGSNASGPRQISAATGAQGQALTAAMSAYQRARSAGGNNAQARAAAFEAASAAGASAAEASHFANQAGQLSAAAGGNQGGGGAGGGGGGGESESADDPDGGDQGASPRGSDEGGDTGTPDISRALVPAIAGAALVRAGSFIASQNEGAFTSAVSVPEEGYGIYRQARAQLAQEQVASRQASESRDGRNHRRTMQRLGAQQVSAMRRVAENTRPRP